jgi:hypothetical protein
MVVTASDLKLVGTMSVGNFLTDFADFNYRANPYIDELMSNYLRMAIYMIDKTHTTIFTYYNVCEDGIKKEKMIHWGIDAKSNVEKAIFYVHHEDWSALYCYLSTLHDEYDMKTVKLEIRDENLVVNDFIIRLYN